MEKVTLRRGLNAYLYVLTFTSMYKTHFLFIDSLMCQTPRLRHVSKHKIYIIHKVNNSCIACIIISATVKIAICQFNFNVPSEKALSRHTKSRAHAVSQRIVKKWICHVLHLLNI